MPDTRHCTKICLLFACAAICSGQTAQITGRITDSTEAVVAGAEIVAVAAATGVRTTAASNEQGYYTLPLLKPGRYQLSVRKSGFKLASTEEVTLEVGQIARFDFSLDLGNVSESITVAAPPPLLSSESAVVGQVIQNKKILDLPLNGRDFTQLATLTPGAISRGTNGATDSPVLSINGGRSSKTVFMIDGANVSNQYYDGASIVPSVDSIQEFRVSSNSFSAEYGQGTGVVNISLKSGTNELHGSAFEFLRNQVFDARNFFNTTGVRPPIKQNQFGFTLGGPITIPRVTDGKDRTFFFADYEGTRIRRAVTNNNVVPADAMRGGDFSGLPTIFDPSTNRPDPAKPGAFIRDPFPGNRIPAERLAPQALYFLPFYPHANTGTGTYVYAPSRVNDMNRFDTRIDHRFSQRDSVAGSYSYQGSTSVTPGNFAVNGAETLGLRKQFTNLTEVHVFSPRMVNELRLSYTRVRRLQDGQGIGTNHTVMSVIGGFEENSREFPGFPTLNISNYLGFNGNDFRPLSFRDNNYQLSDTLSWFLGSHSLKVGTLIRKYRTEALNAALSRGSFAFTGTYTGNAFADFLIGTPASGQRSFPRNAYGIARLWNQSFFVQDDWKLTPRLTINLGLRYDLYHPPIDMHQQGASIDPVSRRIVVISDANGNMNFNGQQVSKFLYPLFADVIIPSSQVGLPDSLRRLDANNFAPRFGIAWRPADDLVFRGGYGIFYGLVQGNRSQSTALVNPPFLADEINIPNTQPVPAKTLANFFPSPAQGIQLGPLTFFQIDPNVRDPYFQEWNVAVQKLVHGVISFEGAYVGSKASKLEFSRPVNVPLPGPGPIQDRRLWTRFASGTYIENSAYSSYHAFQGKVEIKPWNGLSMLASYALAKSLDNLSGDVQGFSSQDPNNNHAEKGPSDFDIRNRFVTSANYVLPFGKGGRTFANLIIRDWELGGILTLQSGLPFTPSISTDPANTGTSRRPNRIGSGLVETRTLDRDFDPAAFATPALYTFGNSGRNILYRRGFKNLDLVALRNFRLRERATLQFRGEFFNITNTPAFGAPVTNIQSLTAGRILSAGEPRDVQLALKLVF